MILYLDTETFSPISIKYGAYKYCEAVRILLVGYAVNDQPAKVWDLDSGAPCPDDLRNAFAAFKADDEARIVMHNGLNSDRQAFLACGFGDIPAEKIVDTMLLAYQHGLPGALGDLCEVFRLDADKAKDKDGKRLIQMFCCPAPGEDHPRYTRKDKPEDWERFVNYCRLDIESMRELYRRMPKFNAGKIERKFQALDAAINRRGMCIDTELAEAAVAVAAESKANLARRTQELTGGEVFAATQRDALMAYLKKRFNIELDSMTKAEVDKRLEDPDVPEPMKELLRLRQASCRTSVQKFAAVLKCVGKDGRLRGCLQFRGASRTGRFSGRLFQPQNLARPKFKSKDVEGAIDLLKMGLFSTCFADPMLVLPDLLRGLIVAPKGRKLVVADYSNIEGRVLAWVAGEKWKLKAFRDFDAGIGHDLYKLTYARTFGVKPEDVTKAQRQMGKVLELALGYGGGAGAFRTFALGYGIDLHTMVASVKETVDPVLWREAEEWYPKALEGGYVEDMDKDVFLACDAVKRAWRKANPAIVALWKEAEREVRYAIMDGDKGKEKRFGPTTPILAQKYKAYLRLRLPSGRYLVYPAAKLDPKDDSIVYYGMNQYSRKWQRIHTFGGKLVENIVQAVACDVLLYAMARLDKSGYPTVLTVHDEIITEVPDTPDFNLSEMASLMCFNPPWAKAGLPLAAAGFEAHRYRKDD